MPPPDGYTVCRELRERKATNMLPVIMLTASLGSERTKGLEAGADDFLAKPVDHDELLARVRSLLRVKRYHDEIEELNRTLEERVRTQVDELERLRRLQRFLSPQLADAVVSSGDDSILVGHRREVAMLFADLRGWTTFSDAVEPEARSDYAAIGSVTNLASRFADQARRGQILITQRLYAEIDEDVEVEPVGELEVAGFQPPVVAFNVVALRERMTQPHRPDASVSTRPEASTAPPH